MTHRSARLYLSLLLAATLCAVGCGPSIDTSPPEGWQADGDRWWTGDADTTQAFRDLSNIETMGVTQGTPVLSTSGAPTEEQITYATKQGLEKLYRKAPETVDSLFARHVAPTVSNASISGDREEAMADFVQESHDRLTEYFEPPSRKLQLGQDIPIPYPDSLRDQGGSVWMQVQVDAQGRPQAIMTRNGAHPVLNDVVRRALTQMRWEPARVRQGDGWRDVPSWTWVNVRLG